MAVLAWGELARMPEAQGGGAVAAANGEIVVAGGSQWRDGKKLYLAGVQIYTIAGKRWRMGAPLPFPAAYGAYYSAGGKLVVMGGTDGERWRDTIVEYDLTAGTWRQAGSAPAPTLLGRAVVHDATPYVFGGCADVADLASCSSDVFRREPAGEWVRAGSLPVAGMANAGAAALGDEIFLFGGCRAAAGGGVENLDSIYAFRPATGKWRRVGAVPVAVRGASATTNGNAIYVAGGYTDRFSDAVYRFEATSGRMEKAGTLPLPVATDFIAAEGRLFGLGGEEAMRSRTNRVFSAVTPR